MLQTFPSSLGNVTLGGAVGEFFPSDGTVGELLHHDGTAGELPLLDVAVGRLLRPIGFFTSRFRFVSAPWLSPRWPGFNSGNRTTPCY